MLPLNPGALIGAQVTRVTVLEPGALGPIFPGKRLVAIDLAHPDLPDFMLIAPFDQMQLWGPTLRFDPAYIESQTPKADAAP